MTLHFVPAGGTLASLNLLQISLAGAVGHIRLNRPDKRNAVNDALVLQLRSALEQMPDADFRNLIWYILAPPQEGPLTPEKRAALGGK